MKAIRVISVLAFMAVAGFIGLPAAGALPVNHTPGAYTCSGGNIPAGTYASVTVAGVCYMPAGNVVIQHDLTVDPHSLLDATAPGDPASTPLLPATVAVGGNISVGKGAVLFLGCSPFIACPAAFTYDTVVGNVKATEPLAVNIHSTSIGGSVSQVGGGGGLSCTKEPKLWLSDPLLANGEGPGVPLPVYSDYENISVGGNINVSGIQTCWFGAISVQAEGNATFVANTMGDPDGNEMVGNLIGGNLRCNYNIPSVRFGDSGAPSNVVTGAAFGQCGFGVVRRNELPGVLEHISVKASTLGRYVGTHRSKTKSVVLGVTSSGDTLLAAKGTAVLTGFGLVGTAKEKAAITIWPDHSASLNVEDVCSCGFDGQSGTVVILAQATVTSHGVTTGSFHVIGASGGLATLVGYGTFTSFPHTGNTLRLVSHLKLG